MRKVLLAGVAALVLASLPVHAAPVDIPMVDLVCKDPLPGGTNGPERGRTGYLYINAAQVTVEWTYDPTGKPGKVHPITAYTAAPDGPGKAHLVLLYFGKDGQYMIAITGPNTNGVADAVSVGATRLLIS
jgi:hypothetical protein